MPKFCSLTKEYVETFGSLRFFSLQNSIPHSHKGYRQRVEWVQQEIMIGLHFSGKSKSSRLLKYLLKNHQESYCFIFPQVSYKETSYQLILPLEFMFVSFTEIALQIAFGVTCWIMSSELRI